MLELKIKAPKHTAKLLINITHVVYVDYIEDIQLGIYIKDMKAPIVLTDEGLIDKTVEQVYQLLKHYDY